MKRPLQLLSLFLLLFTLPHLEAQTDIEQLQKIVASDRGANDFFGFSVAISGDYAIVGAWLEDEDAAGGNALSGAGSAYVFERTATGWEEVQKLVASDRGAGDVFGYSVAISGDYAIVGAWLEDEDAAGGNALSNAGSAYVFERTATGWEEVQKLVASDRGAIDRFGWSVAISGDYAIVGANSEDEDVAGGNALANAGSAYVFERTATGWEEVQKLVASDRGAGDLFGVSVAISGDYAIVGARFEAEDAAGGNALSNAGSAYVFERTATGWEEVQKLVASDRGARDQFGWSVAISGDYAIVGARFEAEDAAGGNALSNAGSAYVFERTATGWEEVQKLVASDRGAGDVFGYSVAISGDYAIVGALSEAEDAAGGNALSNAGSAYVFERTATGWEEVQKLVASDRGAGDLFGFSVAISGDYAIVGARSEAEDAAGGNTLSQAGSAYLFGPSNNPPAANCQNVTVDANANCMGTAVATDFDGGSTDPDGDMLTFSVLPAGPYALGTTNVTLTVSDGTEMSQCTTSVTVNDVTPPTAICQDVTVFVDDAGMASITAADVDGGSSDNCGPPDLSLDITSFNCEDVIISNPNDFALDLDGQDDYLLVADDPSQDLGTDFTLEVWFKQEGSVSGFRALLDKRDAPTNFTNFSMAVLDGAFATIFIGHPSGSFYQPTFANFTLGAWNHYAVTYDGAELRQYANGVLIANVPVSIPNPKLDVPIQIGRAAFGGEYFDGQLDEIRIWNTARSAEQISACFATNLVGNEPSLVAYYPLEDGTGSPQATDVSSTGNTATLTGMDPASDWVVSTNGIAERTSVKVTLTATDNGGLTSSCFANVTVRDTTPPVVTCLIDTVYLNEDGLGGYLELDLFEATDNCEVDFTPFDQGFPVDCSNLGADIIYPITVSDVNGNTAPTCDATVRVLDTIAPVITCVSDTVYLDANGDVFTAPGDRVTIVEDNCPPMAIVGNPLTNFTCDQVGIIEFTQTRTDESGNESLPCTFTITVLDTISPVITVTPQTVVLSDNSGTATLTVDQLASAMDACGIATLTASQLLFTCEDIGEVEVTITATDVNDNVSTATVLVTVLFNQPNLACIGEINVTLDDECGATLTPQMLLTGNTACLDVFSFEIVVQDDVTANGPVIDGCGTFNYMIRSVGTGLFELDFETCWGVVNAEDKTPPQEIGEEEDVELLCVDLDGNNVSTLPASVSKCYRVDGQTGATIFNADGTSTMAPALRVRLLAGGSADDEDARPKVPTFTDGCADELIVCVSDAVQFGMDPDCDDVMITRTFVATEDGICVSAAGEENAPATASYTITFTRPSLDDLRDRNIEPVVYIESCGADPSVRPAPRTGLGTEESPNDFPFLEVGGSYGDVYESDYEGDYDGEEARIFYLSTGVDVCNIGVTFQDGPSIVTCPNTYKFVRTYTVIDWCEPGTVRTFTQVVKVGDTMAPTFVGPNVEMDDDGTLVYGTNAGNSCAAFIRLDDVSVMDNCPTGAVSIIAEIFPNGNLTGAPIGAFTVVPGGAPELTPAIPAGTHILRYTYSDVCGNTGVTDYFFRVEDQTPPLAICEDGLNISIAGGANNGFAVLTPANIDNGSYDDCSGVTLEIARVNASNLAIGGYGPQITLTCADIGTVRVGLKVSDALGNMNFCWLDVLVEDKIAPTCVAPANTTITCVEYNASLPNDIADASFAQLDALFGQAAGVDNCGTTITQTVSGTINSCGVGRITRSFTSTDDVGLTNANVCRQVIDVIGVHDYRITFPTDEEGDCMEIPAFDAVVAEELACDLITTTVDVDTLRTQLAGDECFKLRVTYDVVNWCEYNSLGEPYIVRRDAPGARDASGNPRNIDEDLLYVNVIPGATTANITDDIAFYTLIGTDRVLNNSTNGPAAAAVQQDQEYVGYADNRDSRGFFRYVQFIKIYDEVAPEITFTEPAECFAGSGEGCRTTVTLEFTATDECSDATVSVMLDANFTGVFAADNAAALGISVDVVNDGEGNYTLTATEVPVGDHAIRVRANDGCGNSDVQIIEFCVTADRTPTPICIQTLTVTLMNDGNGGGIAAIWASDFIASPIVDCFGNVVDKYSLYRSSEAGEAGFTPVVGVLGIDDIDCDDVGDLSVRVYAFDNNGSTPDYCEVIVEVQDNMGHCDGSTGDLSGLISTPNDEVIAGVQVSLTSSAGMDEVTMTSATGTFRFTGLALNADYTVQPVFAAAFNAQNVRASDLVAGIGQILGTAPFTSAYQFVAADVNQDGSFDVFDVLAGQRAILGLDDGFAGGNWFMVEAGAAISMSNPYAVAFPEVFNANDLQGTVAADFVAVEKMNLTGATGRMAQTLNVDDAKLESGQFRTIILDGTHTAGFQGTIELAAGLELISADLTGQGGLNLNRAAEGLIAVLLREGGSVSLEVRATTSGLVSELISLSDAVTVREGVALNGTSNGLDLAFNADVAPFDPAQGPPATAQNVLHQNTPNPVRLETVIRFELAEAGAATLTLRDAAGRLISVQEIDAAAGLNTVELTNINASGVLSYTLTAGDFTASRKMVVVK